MMQFVTAAKIELSGFDTSVPRVLILTSVKCAKLSLKSTMTLPIHLSKLHQHLLALTALCGRVLTTRLGRFWVILACHPNLRPTRTKLIRKPRKLTSNLSQKLNQKLIPELSLP